MAVFVDITRLSYGVAGGVQQRTSEELCIYLLKTQAGFKYTCFVSAPWVMRVQAIIAELRDIDDGRVAAG